MCSRRPTRDHTVAYGSEVIAVDFKAYTNLRLRIYAVIGSRAGKGF